MSKHIARAVLGLIAFIFTTALSSAQTQQTQTDTNCTTSPDYGAGREDRTPQNRPEC